jgi:hypothetical protein
VDAERALIQLWNWVDRIVVVGLSMGGLLSLELALPAFRASPGPPRGARMARMAGEVYPSVAKNEGGMWLRGPLGSAGLKPP